MLEAVARTVKRAQLANFFRSLLVGDVDVGNFLYEREVNHLDADNGVDSLLARVDDRLNFVEELDVSNRELR